jgi:hypothetical protein
MIVCVLQKIDKDVRSIVDEAAKQAVTDDLLDAQAIYTDIYANTPAQFVRGATIDHSCVQPKLRTNDVLPKELQNRHV